MCSSIHIYLEHVPLKRWVWYDPKLQSDPGISEVGGLKRPSPHHQQERKKKLIIDQREKKWKMCLFLFQSREKWLARRRIIQWWWICWNSRFFAEAHKGQHSLAVKKLCRYKLQKEIYRKQKGKHLPWNIYLTVSPLPIPSVRYNYGMRLKSRRRKKKDPIRFVFSKK